MTTLMGRVCFCARGVRGRSLFCGAMALLAALLVAASASAELILADFDPLPSSSGAPYELVWTATATGGTLTAGSGALNNGDGASAPSSQTSPGLMLQTPFTTLTGGLIPGEVVGTASTLFYDTSLFLTGLTASGTAGTTTIGSRTLISQVLTSGTFTFLGTDKSTVLLSGTIGDAVITGYQNSTTGAVLSMSVTYTGGKILSALPAGTQTGAFSWDILGLDAKLDKNAQGFLNSFSANATGQFSAVDPVPEPAALVMLGIGGLGLAGYLYRRRRLA
jgi:hypothetical protein